MKSIDSSYSHQTESVRWASVAEQFRLSAARVHAFGGADTWRLVAALQRLAFAALFTDEGHSKIGVEYAVKGGVAEEIRGIHGMFELRFTPTNIAKFEGRTAIRPDQYRQDVANEAAARQALPSSSFPYFPVLAQACLCCLSAPIRLLTSPRA